MKQEEHQWCDCGRVDCPNKEPVQESGWVGVESTRAYRRIRDREEVHRVEIDGLREMVKEAHLEGATRNAVAVLGALGLRAGAAVTEARRMKERAEKAEAEVEKLRALLQRIGTSIEGISEGSEGWCWCGRCILPARTSTCRAFRSLADAALGSQEATSE